MKILLKEISYLATMDPPKKLIKDAFILINNHLISKIGTGTPPDGEYDRIIKCKDMIILPGFINTHHHLYQTLFRNVPEVTNAKLFDWLTYLYKLWKGISQEDLYYATLIGTYEMMLTGVTTTTDMHYLFPKGAGNLLEAEIEAAKRTGIRFYPCRGCMSLSQKDGGLPPEEVVQDEEEILIAYEDAVNKWHDTSKYAMLRIALAPCSPFSVTPNLMKKTAEFAKKRNLLIHTHLAETKDEEIFCLEKFGKRPLEYIEDVGWLTENAWFAHMVWLTDEDINKLNKAKCGIAHCPVSNMRLGSGITPITKMKGKNIKIGIAVDGSASNDTGNFIQEIRTTLLLQRVKYGASSITPYEVLKMATVGGAEVLGIDDYTGTIKEGKAADIIGFKLNTIEFAGGLHDPLSALVMCDANRVYLSIINGKIQVEQGMLVNEPHLEEIIKTHNERSNKLVVNKIA